MGAAAPAVPGLHGFRAPAPELARTTASVELGGSASPRTMDAAVIAPMPELGAGCKITKKSRTTESGAIQVRNAFDRRNPALHARLPIPCL
jgi:hypothetical protein